VVVRSTHLSRRGATREKRWLPAPNAAATIAAPAHPAMLPESMEQATVHAQPTEIRTGPNNDRSTSVLVVLGIVQSAWLLLLAFVLFSLLR
jgi:hypothetical protein